MENPWWQIPGWVVAFLGGAGALKHYFFDRPKVRLRAVVDARSVALYEPVVVFTVTNERKDEVHVSAIKVVRTVKGEKSHDILSTRPSKGTKFRLPGLEEETFAATWQEIFPDDLRAPCGRNDVDEFYVENVATRKRYKLPRLELEAIRDAVEPTLKFRREKTTWLLTCRSCGKKNSWLARPPKADGSFGYGGLGEEPGWTGQEFGSFPMNASALCPACTASAPEADKHAG